MRKRIAMAQGDMTGDGAAETVILTGEQRDGTAYWQNIELEIIDGRSGKSVRVALTLNEGYEPQLLLGCMTDRNRVDALIAMDTGSSGAIGLYTVVGFVSGAYRTLFDSERFAQEMRYTVTYLDQYAVRAQSENTMRTPWAISSTRWHGMDGRSRLPRKRWVFWGLAEILKKVFKKREPFQTYIRLYSIEQRGSEKK